MHLLQVFVNARDRRGYLRCSLGPKGACSDSQLHVSNVYLDGKGRRLIPGEDVFEEEDPLQGRIQLRYRIRFKGGLLRSFGF